MCYCTNCGTKATTSTGFCANCGVSLLVNETSQTVLSEQPANAYAETLMDKEPPHKRNDDDDDDDGVLIPLMRLEAQAPDTPIVSGTSAGTLPIVQGTVLPSGPSTAPHTTPGIGASAPAPLTSGMPQAGSLPFTNSRSVHTIQNAPPPTPPPPLPPLPPLPPSSLWNQIVNFFRKVASRVANIIQNIFARIVAFRLSGLPVLSLPALSIAQVCSIFMALLIVGSITAYGFANNFHFGLPSVNFPAFGILSQHTPTPTPVIPASTATVSIMPMSTAPQETYTITAITGNPNGAKRQVFAHTITATTASVSQTVSATGQGQTQGTQAAGILTFYIPYYHSPSSVSMTFNAGTVFPNDPAMGYNIQIMIDATVTVTVTGNPQYAGANVRAHVVQNGTIGNISAYAFANTGSPPVQIVASAFTGGTDPQPYTYVQQSDIVNAARGLIAANTPNAQQVLQGQVKPNEQFIGTPHCNPNTSANQPTGTQVSQVTVTVNFTCSGEVYDHDGALALAQGLLKQQVQQSYPNIAYALVGTIATTMQSVALTNATNGTVTMKIQVSGTWVAQFDAQLQQTIAQSIAGKTVAQAQALLNTQPGIAVASIQLHGGNSAILPTNPVHITLTIQKT